MRRTRRVGGLTVRLGGVFLLTGVLVLAGCTQTARSTPVSISTSSLGASSNTGPAPTPTTAITEPTRGISARSPSPPPTTASTSIVGSGPVSAGLGSVGVAGVNEARCRSSHRPVLLLHGTFSTVASNFTAMVPELIAAGRCVYALNYGRAGIGAVTDSARQVSNFAARVRAATEADRIDVIAYSQGGLVLRTALRLDGWADKVDIAVLIAPSFHGTTSPLINRVAASLCPACADQAAGSELLHRLDQGGDLDGRVVYAVVTTARDAVVTPVSSQIPHGAADRVRSIQVESRCPQLITDHINLPTVPGVIHWAIEALNTGGRPGADALTC